MKKILEGRDLCSVVEGFIRAANCVFITDKTMMAERESGEAVLVGRVSSACRDRRSA